MSPRIRSSAWPNKNNYRYKRKGIIQSKDVQGTSLFPGFLICAVISQGLCCLWSSPLLHCPFLYPGLVFIAKYQPPYGLRVIFFMTNLQLIYRNPVEATATCNPVIPDLQAIHIALFSVRLLATPHWRFSSCIHVHSLLLLLPSFQSYHFLPTISSPPSSLQISSPYSWLWFLSYRIHHIDDHGFWNYSLEPGRLTSRLNWILCFPNSQNSSVTQ